MKSTLTHFNPDRILARERAHFERRQAMVTKVASKLDNLEKAYSERRNALLERLESLGGKSMSKASKASGTASSGTSRPRVARRGLLTSTVLSLFKTAKQKLTSEQIIAKLGEDSAITKIPDWQKRVYALLNTNKKRFERVDKQTFRVNERPKKSDTLHKNLQAA